VRRRDSGGAATPGKEQLFATLLLYRVLYFLIPFMITITIMGTRELWLNLVEPWRAGRKAEAEATVASSTVTPLKRRARELKRREGFSP
jgi:hypothetical protein